jgi:hypothetical protein
MTDTIHIDPVTDKVSVDCEVYLAMNEDGDWIVTAEIDEAIQLLADHAGGYHARVVKVTVKMSAPVMTEATVEIPDEAGTTEKLAVEVGQ